MMTIPLTLTDEQVEQIADRVAAKLKAESLPEVLTVSQAAEIAQVSTETVRRWVAAGILPKIAGTKAIRIPAQAVRRHLSMNTGDRPGRPPAS